jgi:hypothetical protein
MGTESHVLECETIINKWLETSSISDQSSSTPTAYCSICLDASGYKLQACGHTYCYQCLQAYLSGYFTGRQIKIKCPVDNCDVLLLLRDIKTILRRGKNMENLVKASFEAYIKTDGDLVRCPGDRVSSYCLYIFKTNICLFFIGTSFS